MVNNIVLKISSVIKNAKFVFCVLTSAYKGSEEEASHISFK